MRPSCPLYYNAADILAAFSSSCETDRPIASVGSSPEQRILSIGRVIAVALAGSVRAALETIRSSLDPAWKGADHHAAMVVRAETNGHLGGRTVVACNPGPGRPTLASHFALIAPVD